MIGVVDYDPPLVTMGAFWSYIVPLLEHVFVYLVRSRDAKNEEGGTGILAWARARIPRYSRVLVKMIVLQVAVAE